MKKLSYIAFLLVLCVPALCAAQRQDHAQIRNAVMAFIQAQTQTLPGTVSIQVQDIDTRTARPACTRLEAYLPGGSQLLGKTIIGVRCDDKPGWTLFVQADVRVSVDMLVASHPLTANTLLHANDFSLQRGEMTRPDILTDPAQAVGMVLRFSVNSGQFMHSDMLRAPNVIMQGKTTEVRVLSAGFSVSASGQALNDAAAGQNVQVRMASGEIVSGTASPDGNVDMHP